MYIENIQTLSDCVALHIIHLLTLDLLISILILKQVSYVA